MRETYKKTGNTEGEGQRAMSSQPSLGGSEQVFPEEGTSMKTKSSGSQAKVNEG